MPPPHFFGKGVGISFAPHFRGSGKNFRALRARDGKRSQSNTKEKTFARSSENGQLARLDIGSFVKRMVHMRMRIFPDKKSPLWVLVSNNGPRSRGRGSHVMGIRSTRTKKVRTRSVRD